MFPFGKRRNEKAKDQPMRCAFCSKNVDDVQKLIAGPEVFICDECVAVCVDILRDDERSEGASAGSQVDRGIGQVPRTFQDVAMAGWQTRCPVCAESSARRA